jgi:hypothetical protein
MKWIYDLHDKYKDKEIWIVGSDPRLDNYANNFLDDKLSITLHLAHLKFPNATYRYANELDRVAYLKKEDPAYIDLDNIYALPFFKQSRAGTLEATEEKGYYIKLKPYPPFGSRDQWLRNIETGLIAMKALVSYAKRGEKALYGGFGTCLHACMYVAIIMGCNPINIIGCGMEAIDGKEHFKKANKVDKLMRNNKHFSDPTRSKLYKQATQAIINGCKEEGIKVKWN